MTYCVYLEFPVINFVLPLMVLLKHTNNKMRAIPCQLECFIISCLCSLVGEH